MRMTCILHPAVPPDATLEDQDTMVQVEAIAASPGAVGPPAVPLPCTLDLAAARQDLLELRPAAVFNLVESVDGADSLQYVPAALLDALGIRYTGNPTEAIFQTTHKLLAKQLMHLAGLPTPAWIVCEPSSGIENRPKPTGCGRWEGSAAAWQGPPMPPDAQCIIKAVWEHASRGLDEGNIVAAGRAGGPERPFAAAPARGAAGPASPSSSSRGGSSTCRCWAAATGPEVLPSAEIDFSAFPPGKPRIVGHRAKWEAGFVRVPPYAAALRLLARRRAAAGRAAGPGQGLLAAVRAAGIRPGRFPRRSGRAGRGFWRSTPIRACRPTPVLSPPRAGKASNSTR